MTDETRIRELLDQILDTGCTPEEACGEFPELLPAVRKCWRRVRSVDRALAELFPPSSMGHGGMTFWPAKEKMPVIEGYDLLGILGRGRRAVVYKARHLPHNRMVALKVMPAPCASPQELSRILRETKAVAGLQHPNIVQVYDVGELEGRPYFAMEIIGGGNLAHALAGAAHGAEYSAKLAATLASAVDFAHRHGIVHGDLRPPNVLLTTEGSPKIADFGLGRRLDQGSEFAGRSSENDTMRYVAPEQVMGSSHTIGPATDVYALGALLYKMLTGRPPVWTASGFQTRPKVKPQNRPTPPSQLNAGVPRDLETICLACLRKNPQRRYASAQHLADDLHRFLGGKPILARRARN